MGDIKVIFSHLLEGRYMARRQGNRHPYAIYEGKAKPIYNVSKSNWKVLSPLVKKDKQGRITLNLSTVRSLHGNEWLKQEYKKHKKSTNAVHQK